MFNSGCKGRGTRLRTRTAGSAAASERSWSTTRSSSASSSVPCCGERASPSRRPPTGRRLTLGDLVIDTAAREVHVDGREVELTRIEFDLLSAMAERPRVALTREQLLQLVWGPGWFGDDHVVDVHVSKLRQKL